jgi:hypothetical protein
MQALTQFERYLLAQAIPSLALPELSTDDTVSLWERADVVGYANGELAARGEGNLRALYMILGVLPSSEAERRAVIRCKSDLEKRNDEDFQKH